MTPWIQALVGTVGFVTVLTMVGALALYLVDRGAQRRSGTGRRNTGAPTDPYAQAQELAARHLSVNPASGVHRIGPGSRP